MLNPTPQNPPTTALSFPVELHHALAEAATSIGIEEPALKLWLSQYPLLPTATLVSFLHMIKKYRLDPLADEITVQSYTDSSFQVMITMDGWSKIMNHHPDYAGLSLKESPEESVGAPRWMECSIYRNDRILPIVVKEYLSEIMTDHAVWKQMPRRMLRHRVIQQCARLAFGISSPEHIMQKEVDTPPCTTQEVHAPNASARPNPTRTERLKQQLGKAQP